MTTKAGQLNDENETQKMGENNAKLGKIWSHFSAKPFVLDEGRFIDGITSIGKRGGLWLSDETAESGMSWSQWCIMSDFQHENLAFKTDFTLDMTDILVVDGTCMKALQEFNDNYVKGKISEGFFGPNNCWIAMAKKYKGFAVTPYDRFKFMGKIQYRYFPMDFDLHWHYHWDCASAVIWDYSCIQKIGESLAFEIPNDEDDDKNHDEQADDEEDDEEV